MLLGSGEFRIASTLFIRSSGVVLRGSGEGQTVLVATAREQYTVLQVLGPSTISTVPDSRSYVNESRVPVGSHRVKVDRPELYSPGDLIAIHRPGTAEWIAANGMDSIQRCTPPEPGRDCSQWEPGLYNFLWERLVVAVEGDTLVLDAPLVESIDSAYGGGYIDRVTDGRISHVGVEQIQFRSVFNESLRDDSRDGYTAERYPWPYYSDEQHASTAVSFDNVVHAWASRITCRCPTGTS